jgi:hypothetical protein
MTLSRSSRHTPSRTSQVHPPTTGHETSLSVTRADATSAVWTIQEEAARKFREEKLKQDTKVAEEAKARKEAMRREIGLSGSSSS